MTNHITIWIVTSYDVSLALQNYLFLCENSATSRRLIWKEGLHFFCWVVFVNKLQKLQVLQWQNKVKKYEISKLEDFLEAFMEVPAAK